MDKVFSIKENGFDEIKKGIHFKFIPYLILIIAFVFITNYFKSYGEPVDIDILLFMIPLVILLLALGWNKGIKRHKKIFESYQLTITENEIIRTRDETPTIVIPIQDINSITRHPSGVLLIKGSTKQDTIAVPLQVNEFENLEQLLTNIQPIQYSRNKSLLEKYQYLFIFGILGLFVLIFISTNKLVVGFSGIFLILYFGYSIYAVRQNKNIDKKTKNRIWGSLFIMILVGIMVYAKLGDLI